MLMVKEAAIMLPWVWTHALRSRWWPEVYMMKEVVVGARDLRLLPGRGSGEGGDPSAKPGAVRVPDPEPGPHREVAPLERRHAGVEVRGEEQHRRPRVRR